MRKYLFGGFVAAIVMAGLRYYFSVQEQNQKMDDFVNARLSMVMQVDLDCPPLGRQKVTFSPEDSTPELTSENMPLIIKQWGELWPPAYQALEKAGKDYNGGDKFTDDPDIHVVLPKGYLSTNPEWTIEYDSKGGEYAAKMSGMTVTSAKDAY